MWNDTIKKKEQRKPLPFNLKTYAAVLAIHSATAVDNLSTDIAREVARQE